MPGDPGQRRPFPAGINEKPRHIAPRLLSFLANGEFIPLAPCSHRNWLGIGLRNRRRPHSRPCIDYSYKRRRLRARQPSESSCPWRQQQKRALPVSRQLRMRAELSFSLSSSRPISKTHDLITSKEKLMRDVRQPERLVSGARPE